jgi:hypothetical protein
MMFFKWYNLPKSQVSNYLHYFCQIGSILGFGGYLEFFRHFEANKTAFTIKYTEEA